MTMTAKEENHQLVNHNIVKIRRAHCHSFVLFAIIVVTAISFVYWNQSNYYEFSPLKIRLQNKAKPAKEKPLSFPNVDPKPTWTWICVNTRCERAVLKGNMPLQSLQTCNIACSVDQLWPIPSGQHELGSNITELDPDNFNLEIEKSPSEDVSKLVYDAFTLMKADILKPLTKPTRSRNNETTYALYISALVIKSTETRLRLTTDVSYELSLRLIDKKIVVRAIADSFFGIRHAFETLSQVIWWDPLSERLLTLESATIEDVPRFRYRGLLLDTARNFFPVKDILRTLDAMAASKLNTFHWHATDSQSFPLELKSAPQLVKYGSYGPAAVYSTEDIRTIVRRANLRGIRVVIEVDAPAHVGSAWSWGLSAGFGDLAYCINLEPWKQYCDEPPCGQLNPNNKHVYEILKDIYAEIIDLTGVDDVFHLGGDEVRMFCWENAMRNNNSMPMLWMNFMKGSLNALKEANGGKLPDLTLIWSSFLTEAPYLARIDSKQVGIQIWGATEWETSKIIVDEGFRAVLSHLDTWYLDCGFGSWRDESDGHCSPYRTWQLAYEHRPWLTHSKWHIEGGTTCMWTEQLGPEGLDVRVWPRAAAVAERLWSDPAVENMDHVYIRLDTHRARLNARGIGAAPLWPRWCTDNPYECIKFPEYEYRK